MPESDFAVGLGADEEVSCYCGRINIAMRVSEIVRRCTSEKPLETEVRRMLRRNVPKKSLTAGIVLT